MQRMLTRLVFAGVLAVAALAAGITQEASAEQLPQMKLTEAQVEGFIAAQKGLMALSEKLQAEGEPAPEDEAALEAKIQKDFDAVAQKHGFADFKELDDVSANISLIITSLDPETGEYVDPIEDLKKELAEVKADPKLEEAEKAQLIEELEDALKHTPSLKFEENIALVAKYRERIENALE